MKKLALIFAILALMLVSVSSAQASSIEFVQPRDQRHPGASIQIDSGSKSECVETYGKVTFEDRMTTAAVDLPWRTQYFYAQNICDPHWVEGWVPHLLVYSWSEAEEDEGVEEVGTRTMIGIHLGSERTIPAYEYRVTVQIGDNQEVGRLLTGYAFRDGYNQKIWWGTDGFVNYCINRGKEIRSLHHRLYCIRHIPSTGLEQLRWHKLP